MIVGILLAAGAAARFGGDKLLAELADGHRVGELSCAALRPAVDRLIAVLRPADAELAACLVAAGAEICFFAEAWRGMGASLAAGLAQAPDAAGWLVALGDMPLVGSADAMRVADAVRGGAPIAAPVAAGRRGHPVGFSRRFAAELLALDGDAGARSILARYSADVVEIPVGDTRRWLDVDCAEDLALARQVFNAS